MGEIRNKLEKLKQDINSIGSSFLMLYVKLDFIEKMELEATQNPTFSKALADIDKLVSKALKNIEDYDSIIQIKNSYSEAYIFSKLQSLLNIVKLNESDSKTPDFKLRFRGNDLYLELKSLNMLEGTLKHKNIMLNSLDSHVLIEEQIKCGAKVVFDEQEVLPFFCQGKKYDQRSTRLVIESLIDKINQNIKKEQYLLGDTILVIDLSEQLPLISEPSNAIREKYVDIINNNELSGELWNVAFGKLNDRIFKPVTFEGDESYDGELEKEGLLISHPYIKGLVFHIDENFYSLAELTDNNLIVTSCIEYFSREYVLKNSIM